MNQSNEGYVSKAAAGLANWLRDTEVGSMAHTSVDIVIRSARLPSRDDLLSMPEHEMDAVMETILDRVAAAYTNVEPEALASATAGMIEDEEGLEWFVDCLSGLAAKDDQATAFRM